MAEYIEREATCGDCIHAKICEHIPVLTGFDKNNTAYCQSFRNAADVVEVVRCKDCENFADAKGKDSGKPCGYGQCKLPTGIRGIVCADDFCSFGERREDG